MIRLSFVGDVMCEHTRLSSFQKEDGSYDFGSLFSGVRDEFHKSDVVVANLETPLAGEAMRYSWRDYQFNTPEQFGVAMKNAGVSVVSTANNHVLDRGMEGLRKTLDNLDDIGLLHTGSARSESEAKPLILEVKGKKIGFLSYTYGTEACYNGHYLKQDEAYAVNLLRNQELTNPVKRYFLVSKNLIPRAFRALCRRILPGVLRKSVGERREKDKRQKARLFRDIAYAKEHSDYVVMCLHCGGQFNSKPTEYTREIAALCLEHGVNAVIGNHEHLIQGSRMLDPDRIVAYCLGNFTSNYGIDRKPYDKNAECSVLLHLYLDEETGRVDHIGFEILISVKEEDGIIRTRPLFDCIAGSDGEKRQELCEKNRRAVGSFLGTDPGGEPPRKEYVVSRAAERTSL